MRKWSPIKHWLHKILGWRNFQWQCTNILKSWKTCMITFKNILLRTQWKLSYLKMLWWKGGGAQSMTNVGYHWQGQEQTLINCHVTDHFSWTQSAMCLSCHSPRRPFYIKENNERRQFHDGLLLKCNETQNGASTNIRIESEWLRNPRWKEDMLGRSRWAYK